jgi:maltose alpha-D-glucosyltransferase/alpha-amylase
LNSYARTADGLGRLTAAMHRALASGVAHPAIAPEPFGKLYQRSVYQGMRTATGLVFRELARRLPDLPADSSALAERVLADQANIGRRFRAILSAGVGGMRIRVHGNYHLGRLLHTGAGFAVADFSGEPDRPLTERRIKRSPLRDVASMVRSLHYAALTPLYSDTLRKGSFPGRVRPEDRPRLLGWGRFWASWASARFVRSYFTGMAGTDLLPTDPAACRDMLEVFVLERAVRELGQDLEARPGAVAIPLGGIIDMIAGR